MVDISEDFLGHLKEDLKGNYIMVHKPENNYPHIHVNGIYQHYKGTKYRVITTAVHTETGEEMVVYESLDRNKSTWCRPLSIFIGIVRNEVGQEAYRFSYQGYGITTL